MFRRGDGESLDYLYARRCDRRLWRRVLSERENARVSDERKTRLCTNGCVFRRRGNARRNKFRRRTERDADERRSNDSRRRFRRASAGAVA